MLHLMKTKLFLSLLLGFLLPFACSAGMADKTLDIYWIDVEGGAATLIVTPQNESVLIDSGWPGGRDPQRILQVAKNAGLKKIDYLITTHFHIDHFGGAAELSELMPIGTLYDNGIPDSDPDNNPADTRFRITSKPYREMKVGKRKIIHPDDVIALAQSPNSDVSGVTLRCLAAKQVFTKRVPKGAQTNSLCAESTLREADTSDNKNSVVTLLSFGPFRFFDGGDLTWNMETRLVCPVNLVGPIDVYQVDHHGTDLSNNPLLVQTLAPTVSVMDNGAEKGGNPNSLVTMKNTPSIKARYQLHKSFFKDAKENTDDEYIANLERKCDGNYIKMSVAPDGKSYAISIPSNGHKQTFQTKEK
jgi:beta-lactamase superfamily II metal-dependent hydrolase